MFIADNVLVLDVSDNGMLYYYCGYFKNGQPVNSNDYVEAMKIRYPEEARTICDHINELKDSGFKYHVEKHKY